MISAVPVSTDFQGKGKIKPPRFWSRGGHGESKQLTNQLAWQT
jgi:hypothetical protein